MMVDETERAVFMQSLSKKMGDMRVVDFQVVNVTMDKEKRTALAVVDYSYYLLRTNDLVNRQEIQHWRLGPKKEWQLSTKSSVNP